MHYRCSLLWLCSRLTASNLLFKTGSYGYTSKSSHFMTCPISYLFSPEAALLKMYIQSLSLPHFCYQILPHGFVPLCYKFHKKPVSLLALIHPWSFPLNFLPYDSCLTIPQTVTSLQVLKELHISESKGLCPSLNVATSRIWHRWWLPETLSPLGFPNPTFYWSSFCPMGHSYQLAFIFLLPLHNFFMSKGLWSQSVALFSICPLSFGNVTQFSRFKWIYFQLHLHLCLLQALDSNCMLDI